jgi:hypothetical protein
MLTRVFRRAEELKEFLAPHEHHHHHDDDVNDNDNDNGDGGVSGGDGGSDDCGSEDGDRVLGLGAARPLRSTMPSSTSRSHSRPQGIHGHATATAAVAATAAVTTATDENTPLEINVQGEPLYPDL